MLVLCIVAVQPCDGLAFSTARTTCACWAVV